MQRISHLKIVGIILPMVLTLLMLPMEANAYSAGYKFEYGGLWYTVLNEPSNTVACSGYYVHEDDIVIPEKVNITGITYTVVQIGNHAFDGCYGLTSITIPNSVTAIGGSAFSGCSRLTSITIPNSVTTIGSSTFDGCSGLTSITIPNSVTAIGNYAFEGCSSLTSINVDAANQAYSSKDGVLYNKEQTSLIRCPERKLEVIIPNSVTDIDAAAFEGCSSLTSITIPNSVTAIDVSAFFGCSSLTNINVDAANQAYSSKDGVLYNKEQTSLIRCPGGKRGEVIIPNSVTTIGESAFFWCSSLTSITIPNSVTAIGYNAFYGCSRLTSITIPNSVTTIGSSTFYGCSGLTSITIPNSVTAIGYRAFPGCSGLTSITIPNSVTTIGNSTFYGCSGLTSVYYIADEPIEFANSVFDWEIYNNATLYVPANAVNKCRQIDPWKNFKSIEAYDFAGVDDISVDAGADLPCEVYNINGVKIAESTDNLAPGIYIVRQGSNVKKIVVN